MNLLQQQKQCTCSSTTGQKIRKKADANKFFISDLVLPQTVSVLKTKAEGLGIEVVIGDHKTHQFDGSYYEFYYSTLEKTESFLTILKIS